MSPSKEALIHKWKTARHIFAASLLGVSAITAGGAEASSRFDRILQEVPAPVVVPEETVEEVEQEEQEPESGIQATIPPTPVVLVLPTPTDEVAAPLEAGDWPNYREHIANMRAVSLEVAASLPEFSGQGYQTFTYNGGQVPFGMIDSRDINMYMPFASEWDLSTHAVAITDVERQTFQWPGYPDFVVEYLFVTFQYENATFVASHGASGGNYNVDNVKTARDGDLSQISGLRITFTELEARYREAMQDGEQVIIQFWNNTTAAGYQNREDAVSRAWEEYQSTAHELLIDAIETGNVSPQAGIQVPNTIIFLHQ